MFNRTGLEKLTQNTLRERERERSGMAISKHALSLWLSHLLLLLQTHSKCQKSYACRNFSLEFPFTNIHDPECGLFTVDGCDSDHEHPRLYIGATTARYQILGKPSTNKFLIRDFVLQTLLDSPKCYSFMNVTLPHSPSVSFTFSPNLTFFTCFNKTTDPHIQHYFHTYHRLLCEASTVYYKIPATHHAPDAPPQCRLTQLPIKSDVNSTNLLHLLTPNFTLEWSVSEACYECNRGGGQCATINQNDFYCETGVNCCLWLSLSGRNSWNDSCIMC